MKTLTTCLWFDGQALDAAKHYVKLFRGKLGDVSRYGEGSYGKPGTVMSASFRVLGQPFLALNGGPHFQLTPAVSFMVPCKDQKELDRVWKGLLRGGGKPQQCGWITDGFGVTWQVLPENLQALIADPRAMQAMLKMVKLDIAALEAASGRKRTKKGAKR